MLPEHFIATVNITDAQLNEIYESAAHRAGVTGDEEERPERREAAERLSFRHRDIALIVEHPGGGIGSYHICTRNLTPQGVSVVHGGYLHRGTRAKILLPTIWGGEEAIRGRVLWCRVLSGMIHEAGVRFETPVDLWRFLEGEEGGPNNDRSSNGDHRDLDGRVLLLDDLEIECRMCEHHLAPTKLELVTCTTLVKALELVRDDNFDAVLCDINLGDLPGEEAIKAIRKTPFLGPIIALTGESNPSRMRQVKQAGADAIVRKPYDPKNLLAVLSEWISKGGADGLAGPMYSQLASQERCEGLLDGFFEFVEEIKGEMKKAITADDVAQTRRVAQDVRETAGGYGFPAVSEAAERAVTALDSSCSITESTHEIQRLQTALRLVRKGRQPAEKAA